MTKRFPLHIRFADVDMAGHVHNAVYLQYFESARIQYLSSSIPVDWSWKKVGIVLARNEVDYLKPIFLQDRIEADVTLIKVGDKSFDLEYAIVRHSKGAEEICARGKSVQVIFDFERLVPVGIPVEWGLEV
jgi:acyl-CoA thioester hydrolase